MRQAVPQEPVDLHRRVLEHLLQTAEATAVEELFFDPVTSLPTLQLLLPHLREALAGGKGVGILVVNIAQFSKLEDIYGWESFDEIVRGVASCLKSIKDDFLRKDDALAELTVNGNVFILILSPPRKKRSVSFRDLSRLKERISKKLDSYLHQTLEPELLHRFGYFIGGSVMRKEASIRLERLVYRAIDDALTDAASEKGRLVRKRSRELRAILERGRISTVYQPILDLRSRKIMAYEALSRGPRGALQTPGVLFQIAYETELIWKLDRVCRERALRGLRRMKPDQLLFINMEPVSVFDPKLLRPKLINRFASQIVFEITEHAAIADFSTFRQAVQVIKRSGFKIAVDDVGAAYSGLRVISEIEPDFVKLDMALTRGAHNSRVKMQLIEAIAKFCNDAELPLIMEGVETQEEFEAMGILGIHLLQGFFFAEPVKLPGAEKVLFPETGVTQEKASL